MQCTSCANAKKYASCYSNNFDQGPPPAQTKIKDMLRDEVRKLYNEPVSDDKFRQDINLIQSMKSLPAFGVIDVSVLSGNLVRMCGSTLCHQISGVQQ